MRGYVLGALLAAMSVVWHAPAEAVPRARDLVTAELLAEPATVVPGEAFYVGIRLTTKPHWHTYWRNPGDSGLPTEVKWTLPPGFSAGPILWPAPERIPVSHLVNYGYEGETVLLARITPDASVAAGTPATLAAEVSYLVCEKECIPGDASLSTTLPVGAAAPPDAKARAVFDAAREKLPAPAPWPVRTLAATDGLTLAVDAPGLAAGSVKDAYFFPYDETAIEHAAPQPVSPGASGLTLALTRSSLETSAGPLAGVLVFDETAGGATVHRAYEVGPALLPAAAAAPAGAPRAASISPGEVLAAMLLALAGGLVLNLMPCVFPVLSIKVLSLVHHSGFSPRLVRLNGLAYAAGVVASFVALALVLMAARAAGGEIGWGFQLQSPAFVAGLAFLLFAMGLSLSGAVELGTSLAGLGGGLASRSGLPGSFLTGVLATVVATPCTAPFMGTAIGYGLAAPALVAVAVFAALGIGLALPFLVLTVAPGLVRFLPRPGAWMDILKQVLAFPIYATVAWLIFVLSQEVGPTALFAALIGLVLVGFAAWALRLGAHREVLGRRLAAGAVAAALVALGAIGVAIGRDPGPGPAVATAEGGAEPFTQARLDSLRAEGRPVFVNMTAAWCITCLVNERTTLSRQAVRDAFADRRIAYLKGDWTNQNPEITRLLESHGRDGVPLYVLYPARGEPVVLPQILTESAVIESLDRLGSTKRAALDPSSHSATTKE